MRFTVFVLIILGAGCSPEPSVPNVAEKHQRVVECLPPHGWDLVPHEPAPLPEFPQQLPAPNPGDAMLRGAVTAGNGEPIGGARVRFVSYLDYTDVNPRAALLAAAITDVSGAFALSHHPIDRPDDTLSLVVDAQGLTRELGVPMDQLREHWSVRMSRARRLPIRLHCTELFEEESIYAPDVEVHWRSASQQRVLDTFWTATRLVPATCQYRPEGETNFSDEIEVPIGSIELRFANHCGRSTRRIEVPQGEGTLPALEIELPQADSGALEIHFTAPEQPPCPRSYCRSPPWSTEVWQDPERPIHLTLWRSVRGGVSIFNTARLRGLPPGEYSVGQRDTPEVTGPIRIAPHETTVLEMNWQDEAAREGAAVD